VGDLLGATPRRVEETDSHMKKKTSTPTTTHKAKVMLIDDHPIMREGMAQCINHEADMAVCAEAGTAHEALAAIARTKPDIAIVDLSLGESHGLELIKDINAQHPKLAMLVFSMHDESLYAERVLHAGARGYVMKQTPPQTVLCAIRQVLAGEVYLSAEMTRRLMNSVARTERAKKAVAPVERLSDREYEVFDLIGRGYTTKEIAHRLRLSYKTVASHRENIRHKLGFPNSAALLRQAIQCVRDGGA
jgi:DNA-binding NarL/FixJ family response regulator